VDVAKLKAEFLQQYYDAHGVPFRSQLIARFSASARLGLLAPGLYNFMMTNSFISKLIKSAVGFAVERSMPTLHGFTLHSWYTKHQRSKQQSNTTPKKKVYLFCDEFTNYNDTSIGIKAIQLLEYLGYDVEIPLHEESGRSWLSKGLLREAKKIANKNISLLSPLISAEIPLIGIEPSAILTFRDEYPDLATDENLATSRSLSENVFLIDEFLASEIEKGNIKPQQFTTDTKKIMLHGHCQQKALSSVSPSVKILSLPSNYTVETIPSGCCGMAGSFGYEKEHYDLSMKIGELVLFPAVRKQDAETIIAAPGTSCRHQVKDGTGKKAMHPVEILWDAILHKDL
jgi:Fe-S oxidoreductase